MRAVASSAVTLKCAVERAGGVRAIRHVHIIAGRRAVTQAARRRVAAVARKRGAKRGAGAVRT